MDGCPPERRRRYGLGIPGMLEVERSMSLQTQNLQSLVKVKLREEAAASQWKRLWSIENGIS